MSAPPALRRAELAFERSFGRPPEAVARGPGRVNLIGEHTDYNDGFVLPMAIDRAAFLAMAARDDGTVRIRADDLGEELSFEIEETRDLRGRGETRAEPGGWIEYARGVAWALQDGGLELRGFDGALAADVPRGAGLSSSAAVELAIAVAFWESTGFDWDPKTMARSMQRAENAWVGVQTGIMDQLVGACGVRGHALLIDCRSLWTRSVPLPDGIDVLVLDTATRRSLVGSAYDERRRACEAAAAALGVQALRDADEALLDEHRRELDDVVYRRARHVVRENERTLAAADAMRLGDAARLGELMDESHASLRDDFEVSSPALDAIVEVARAVPGCLGARMTGAGFGGCAVAIVESGATAGFAEAVGGGYRARTGLEPIVYLCRAADGAGSLGRR